MCIIWGTYQEDGSELYGKGLATSLETDNIRHRPRPDIDKIFLDLTSYKNIPKIRTYLDRIITRANTAGIQLPYDDPIELRVRPDGKKQFICLDVDQALTEPVTSENERSSRIEKNKDSQEFVLDTLNMIRDHLLDA